MNQFTKDELHVILLDMKFYAEQKKILGLMESSFHVKLKEKAESMIDNYCEHDQGYEQDSMMVDICKKCKEVF